MNSFYDAGPRIVLHHSALLESVDNGESGVLNHTPGRVYYVSIYILKLFDVAGIDLVLIQHHRVLYDNTE